MNKSDLIGQELAKAVVVSRSFRSGMLVGMGAYETIVEASNEPDPTPLWLSLWYTGEVCCLFADSNLGKSIYAVQIATQIASTQKVLYFDFELSKKQFQLRYTDEVGNLYRLPDNLYRVQIDPNAIVCDNFEDAIINDIENAALQAGAKVLIVDNLTYLCMASEKGDNASALMMRLMELKRKYALSILVIAHTPKRSLVSPISQNDLAGSKKLFNFFDSVFAIGKSAKDNSLRYIKQLKVRYGNYRYDADNVIVCSIEKRDGFVQFITEGYAAEREHLKELTEKGDKELVENVKGLHSQGKSYREIAKELSISLGMVQRILKK